jgi:putative MATE family efflux protein
MVGTSSMRATGDTVLPGKLMMAGALLNVILDPIFIFGIGPIPAMGLDGAATAALMARGSMFIGTVYFMVRRLDMISFHKPNPKELRKSWADILHVGLPAAGTNAIIPVAMTLITAMIARYGPEAVAGFGVASRIESLVLVIFYALSSVIGPFVGQNLSAGQERRIQLSLRLVALFCMASGLVIALVLALAADFVPTLFSQNPDVTDVTRMFLWIAPVSYGAYGVVMVMNAAFNGLGKPMPAVYISATRMLLLYLPLAVAGRAFFGIPGIFAAYAVANILSGLLSYLWARRTAHNLLSVSDVHPDSTGAHEQKKRQP